MPKNLLTKAIALVKGQLHNAGNYHVGVILRWHWLERSLAPLFGDKARAVLDAGSGGGLYAFRLARRYRTSSFLGVEIDPARVKASQTQLRAERLANLEFVQGDLTQSQGMGRYDLIYNVDVIEHIEDDRLAIRNLAQALRGGGRLVMHTPLAPQRHWFRRFDLDQRVQSLHVREGYAVDDLLEKLRAAGLTPIDVVYTHGRWGTLAWELWRLVEDRWLLSLLMRLPVTLLVGIEKARPPKWGNCVLVVAVKPTV